jgi:hypothetical protein
MRRVLSGLGGWLAMAWLAVACSYEIDSKLCLEDDHCDKGEVCMLSHACIACSGDACPAHERCAADGDCGDDEVCSGDGLCRVRCVVDAQCISGKCDEPACAAPIGEPCLEYETPCVGDTCIDTDNALEPVAPYCSQDCLPEPCPVGYECVQNKCRTITDGEVCNYPDPSGICAACVWEHCSYDLDDCCQGQLCSDVYSQIAICDRDRINASCVPLANPSGFAGTSEELRSCLELFCNEGECLPSGL